MNLRDQLKTILPDILPPNPADSVKGTELIELVKYRLNQDYSDATLRYHFSIMSCDPSSPIAKVEHGQGYYLRSTTIHSLNSARNLISTQGFLGEDLDNREDVDVMIARANKFRSVFRRFCELNHEFPFTFERSFSDAQAGANRWRFPDAAVVEWTAGAAQDEQYRLHQDALEVRRRLGQAPFLITSIKLKLDITYGSLREDLFQCLSTSLWANRGEVVVAAPIVDEQLLEEIRILATRFGIGVTSFGLDSDVIDGLPEPAAIDNMLPREFEALQGRFTRRRISAPRPNAEFDWQHIDEQAKDHPDFALLRDWLSRCLLDEEAYPLRDFLSLSGVGKAAPGEEHVA